jgi:hypothetical protein
LYLARLEELSSSLDLLLFEHTEILHDYVARIRSRRRR